MGLVGMFQVVPELVGITGQSVAIPDMYEPPLGISRTGHTLPFLINTYLCQLSFLTGCA